MRTAKILIGLTFIALLIHGYHPYAEDAEIYLPGILKVLHPDLYPVNNAFFGEHAGHTLYPNLIAGSVRLLHLPFLWTLFLWHIASIFLMLLGTWRLATALFNTERARYAALCSMAALFTLPAAGTDLYIIDQYLNPRNLAAFAAAFALAEILHRRYAIAGLWLIFAAVVHPFMASFAILFCAWLVLLDRVRPRHLGFAAALPFGLTLAPPPPAYHEVALRQPAHFILRWEWYEWLGIVGPLVLFWIFARLAQRRGLKNIELVARAMIPFIGLATVAAVVLNIPARLEALTRVQPMRSLALCYMLLVVIGGGLIGEYLLQAKVWRWLALFLPMAFGMWFAQRQLFPASSHIEWPWASPKNQWAQAFVWIRDNTPTNALFALDPMHMEIDGEDEIGFRALAQRSMLADGIKDKGAVSMFPPMSTEWLDQFHAQQNWRNFAPADFEQLRARFGVDWVVLQQPGIPTFTCPYQNAAVRVCRVD